MACKALIDKLHVIDADTFIYSFDLRDLFPTRFVNRSRLRAKVYDDERCVAVEKLLIRIITRVVSE